jgi:phage major head subunit gpT-like protein
VITPAQFSVFVTTVNTMIGQAYNDTTEPILDQIATTIPMSTEILLFGWTGMLDQMRPWYGPRVAHEPNPQTYQVAAIPFEYTLTIDRFRLDDDQFGIYYRMLPDVARQAKRWPTYQIRNLLENTAPWTGSFQNGLDGLSNFNTAHLINLYNSGLGTYSNDFTGGGSNVGGIQVGGAFSPTAFATLYEYMLTLKGEDNQILGIVADKLMHPAQLKTEVDYVLKSQFFAAAAYGTLTGQVGAADNMFRRFGVEPLQNNFLTSATKWYLMDTTKPMKPFTWGLREAPIFVQRVNEDDPVVFDEHNYVWGNWGRGCAAWSYAWLCCRSGS